MPLEARKSQAELITGCEGDFSGIQCPLKDTREKWNFEPEICSNQQK
jgi:hypothetical protein